MSTTEVRDIIAIRHACPADIPAMRAMQKRSLLVLGGTFYAPAEIATFLSEIGTMDDAVVYEGHYFVAASADGAILASGGWSHKTPSYDRAVISGAADRSGAGAATVRSVFVDPAAARRGIATAIMARVEQDAAAHGIGVLIMMATLSGLSFYARLGYQAEGEKTVVLPNGLRFECITMSKTLSLTMHFAPHRSGATNDARAVDVSLRDQRGGNRRDIAESRTPLMAKTGAVGSGPDSGLVANTAARCREPSLSSCWVDRSIRPSVDPSRKSS